MFSVKILKLGGSAITDKTKPFLAREDVIKRVAKEIVKANPKHLIIIHGGGSFGHPLAKKYRLKEGFKEKNQIKGFAETRWMMMILHKLILDSLISNGVNAVSFPPFSFVETTNQRISHMDVSILKKILKFGLVPVLHGDVVVDRKLGFTILSGDQLAARLAIDLKAEKIVLATDVDGVYTSNPKTNPNAKMISQLSLSSIKETLRMEKDVSTMDVTGTMVGKLKEMVPAVNFGVKVFLVNALKNGRIYKALKGLKVKGTILKP